MRDLTSESPTPPAPIWRFVAAVELTAVISLFGCWLWLRHIGADKPLKACVLVAAVTVLVVSCLRVRVWAVWPAARVGGARAWLEAAVFTLGGAGAIAAARLIGEAANDDVAGTAAYMFDGYRSGPAKVLGPVIQQLLLHLYLRPICRQIFVNRWAGLCAAAAVFGFMHAPNWVVVGLCAVAGAAWMVMFERAGRMLPLILSHLVLTISVRTLLAAHVNLYVQIGGDAATTRSDFDRLIEAGQWEPYRRLAGSAFWEQCGRDDEAYLDAVIREAFGPDAAAAAAPHRAEWLEEIRGGIRERAVRAVFRAAREVRARPVLNGP